MMTLLGMPVRGCVGAGDAGIQRTHRRLGRIVAAGNGHVILMVGVARRERADDGKLVGHGGELGEGAAEGDAGQARSALRR